MTFAWAKVAIQLILDKQFCFIFPELNTRNPKMIQVLLVQLMSTKFHKILLPILWMVLKVIWLENPCLEGSGKLFDGMAVLGLPKRGGSLGNLVFPDSSCLPTNGERYGT